MPHKGSATSGLLPELAALASPVHIYVCSLTTRALSRQGLLEGCRDADVVLPVAQFTTEAELLGAFDEEMLSNRGDEEDDEELEDWVVFEGDLNVVSEFRDLATADTYQLESSDCVSRTSSSSSFGKLRWGKEQFAGAMKKKVAYVGEVSDKIVGTVGKMGDKMCALNTGLAGMWDACDEAGERYAQQMEEIVKIKASVISDVSKSSYQDACASAAIASWKLETKAACAVEQSRGVCQDMESKFIQSGAMMTSKATPLATAVSKVATMAPTMPTMKTGGLPTYTDMRRSFTSVVQKPFWGAGRTAANTPAVQA